MQENGELYLNVEPIKSTKLSKNTNSHHSLDKIKLRIDIYNTKIRKCNNICLQNVRENDFD